MPPGLGRPLFLIISGYVIFQVLVRPFIPALCVILPQVGTIEFRIFANFALAVQFVLDAWRWLMP
jgi:hypothetical protein